MPAPTNVVANCPPGLEYLTQIDQIRIHQQIELFQSIIISFVYHIKTDVICKYIFQVFTGYEADKKYVVKNSLGQKIFLASKKSYCCDRYCCGRYCCCVIRYCCDIRDFQMTIVDNFGNEVIHLKRTLACQCCCYPFCLQVLIILSIFDKGTRLM